MVVSQYTGYSSVSRDDALTYANCGTNDWIANWQVKNPNADVEAAAFPFWKN